MDPSARAMADPDAPGPAGSGDGAPTGGLQPVDTHAGAPPTTIPSSVHSIGGALASGTTPSMTLARAITQPPDAVRKMPPLELFKAQLGCDSSEARVDCMKRLYTVALAIGLEATLSDLLPHVATTVAMEEEEEDEVLLILGEQLGMLVPSLIPGEKALPILPILERLCAVEETVVREGAVKSVRKIIPLLLAGGDGGSTPSEDDSSEREGESDSPAPPLLLAMSKRLAGADWFTARISSSGILPTVYRFIAKHADASARKGDTDAAAHAVEGKRELRQLYRELCEDDTPMVRRGAAKHLAEFAEAVASLSKPASSTRRDKLPKVDDATRRIVTDEMVPLFRSLSADEQDSVRLLAVSGAGSIGAAMGCDPELAVDLILAVITAGCSDLSWRVRHHLAKEYATVASNTGFATSPAHATRQAEVFTRYSDLLQDHEAEVRTAAAGNVARMADLGGARLFEAHIAPLLPALADDPVVEVRSQLAKTLMDCVDPAECTALDDRVVLRVFRPLLEGFLADEFAEVQLRVLTKLSRVSRLLGQMDAVVSTVLAMAKAPNWRVREAVSRLLPHLAEARGVPFFEDHLLEPWLQLLMDRVANVRAACAEGMPKLLSVAGPAWVRREVLPHHVRIYDDPTSGYLSRITILRSYAALLSSSGEEASLGPSGTTVDPDLLDEVVGLMLRGLEDRVANVRMVAARGIADVAMGRADGGEAMGLGSRVRPALTARASEDEDADCKHFAQIALNACA